MATLHALNTHAFTLRPAWAATELGSAAASALVGARQAAALQAADAPLLSRLAAVSSLLFPARLPKTSATPCCKLPKAAPCCCAGMTGALLRVHLRFVEAPDGCLSLPDPSKQTSRQMQQITG
jgi:hypothetical protein